MGKKTLYIIIGIVAFIAVLFVTGVLRFSRGNDAMANESTATNSNTSGDGNSNFFGLGSWQVPFDTNRKNGESFNAWYKRRSDENWAFKTNLI